MSVPFYGKKFTFTQPNGTELQVRGYGNQSHAVFETLDGYTVVQDPVSGYYQYAIVSGDGEDLQPTGSVPGITSPAADIAPRVRIKREAAKAKALESRGLPRGRSRWETRRQQFKSALKSAMDAPGILPAPPQRQTVGTYVGLCLLIEFPDVPATITRQQVEDFCNKPGYNGFGNKGSVNDYFLEVSSGKLKYTNVVAPYYKAKHPRAYYIDENVAQPKRARELIKEALDFHKNKGFDFSKLTVDNENYVYALNVFYTGQVKNNWAKGLWPHAYHLLNPYPLLPGKSAFDYQVTNMGEELTLGTFCHENGHMICDFPDLYDYGYESRGVGVYCLMCAGGSPDEKNPAHVGAYLKYRAGWANKITKLNGEMEAKAVAGSNEFFLKTKNQTEYFIIENRMKKGRDSSLTSAGLAIWHVDELGDNSNEHMTADKHYECTLIQADGNNDLENGVNDGDQRDLFHSGFNAHFAETTTPASKWWDGSSASLEIYEIGATGAELPFKVKA